MLLKILSGVAAGIIGGMGLGGGIVLIPVLTLLFDIEQKVAQGINLVCFIPTGICALVIHIKNKCVDIKPALILALFGILGCVAGCIIVKFCSPELLRKMFALFLTAIGVKEFFSLKQ